MIVSMFACSPAGRGRGRGGRGRAGGRGRGRGRDFRSDAPVQVAAWEPYSTEV